MCGYDPFWVDALRENERYLYREKYSADAEELDYDGEANNRRDERDYQKFLDEN